MPHECVSCGEVFDDGSDEVFEGCPDCGATKFFYVKEVTEEPTTKEMTEDASPEEMTGEPASAEPEDAGAVTSASVDSGAVESEAQTRARNQTYHPDGDDAHSEAAETTDKHSSGETATATVDRMDDADAGAEDDAYTDDDIVEAESEYERSFGGKLNDTDESTTTQDEPDGQVTSSGGRKFRRARPEEARRRLMDQFETIRIVEPGSYELNLMNLYDSDEKIIALQEDGRYQVSLPSTFDND